mmetsp:Transcript_68165/g.127264  ORF Transcript_68165/g.127264 Transcript_68165/m.127264 type:complete len:164 (-) Transcript_68165:136-627(-)
MVVGRRRSVRKTLGPLAIALAVVAYVRTGFKLVFAVPRTSQSPCASTALLQASSSVGAAPWATGSPSPARSTVPRQIFGLGTTEILVILAVGAVVLGPEALKGMAKEAGKAAGDLKDVPKAFEEGMDIAQSAKTQDVEVTSKKKEKEEPSKEKKEEAKEKKDP